MKHITKIALAALVLTGAAVTNAAAFTARIAPVPAGPICDLGTRFYNPAYCSPRYYGYGPDFVYHGYWWGGRHGGHGGHRR